MVFTWAIVVAAVVMARHVTGKLHIYLFYYVYGMVGLLYVSVMQALLTRRPAALPGVSRRAEACAALAGLALLIPWLMFHPVAPPPARDDVTTVVAGLSLTEARALHLSLGQSERDRDLWHLVPTFALQLRRAGVHVTVDERFVGVCGEEMRERADGPRPPALLFTRDLPPPGQSDHVQVADWGVFLIRAPVDSTRAGMPALPATRAGSANTRRSDY
jgi:hypothetical protein